MFTVYIDDSGTDPKQAVAIASVLIIPASALIKLEKEWEALETEEHFKCFHTSECVAKNKKKVFAEWDDIKQARVLRRVRDIAKTRADRAFSFAVNKSDYDEVVPLDVREFCGKFHYTWAVRNVIEHAAKWADDQRITAPLEWVFDNMDKESQKDARAEIEAVMVQAEYLNPGKFSGHWSFRNRCEVPALQCTDMLAWSCYQAARRAFHRKRMTRVASTCFNDFEQWRNGKWLLANAATRITLQTWGKREQASPRGQRRRREWKDSQTITR